MLDLVPLYALEALEGPERDEFAAHLQTCPECRAALDHYRSVAAELVPDDQASDATWDRISNAISASDAAVSTVANFPGRSNDAWKWMAGAAAAAAAILGTLLVIDNLDSGLTSDSIVAAAEQLADEPGSIVGDFLVDDVSVARVILSADGRGFVIPTPELDPLDEARTYQLWVINDIEDVISAGVLGNNPAPATFTWTGDVTGFALTREVAGGVVSSEGDVVSVIADV